MPRSTEHAALICLICTIITLAGFAAGYYFHKPLIMVLLLLPAVLYEVYRTEGVSTIWASWGMLAVLAAEAVLMYGNYNINLSKYVSKYINGLPVIDLKLIGPVVIAYFSYVLLRRTSEIYTKWLALVIFIGSAGLFLLLDPSLLTKLAGGKLDEQFKNLPFKK